MTEPSSLIRNSTFNFLGQFIPLIVGFIAIPFLVRGIGTEKFGVLSLAWMAVGYFTIFDIGIGRATTKHVAEYIARDNVQELIPLVWTSLAMLSLLGILGGVSLLLFSPLIVGRLLRIPLHLQPETLQGFRMLSLAIPVVILSAGARGVLEGLYKFGRVNSVAVISSSANYLLPLATLYFSHNLFHIISILVVNRILVLVLFLIFVFRLLPDLKYLQAPKRKYIKGLVFFGGWLAVSNVIGTIMLYVDRFLIGGLLSMTAVTYYSTPYELMTKLAIIPLSLTLVLFPTFSSYSATQNEKLSVMHDRAVKFIMLVLLPIVLVIIISARPFLHLWLGEEFAIQSTAVLQLLALSMLFSSLALIPLTTIQASGRPDLSAKLHLFELPIYIGMLWSLTVTLGITGAALAWVLRSLIDAVCLFLLTYKILDPATQTRTNKSLIVLTSVLILCLGLWKLLPSSGLTVLLSLAFVLVATYFTWRFMLDGDEKRALAKLFSVQSVSYIFNRETIR